MFTSLRLMLIAIFLSTSIAVSFASPADAHRYHRRHKHDGFDVGDAIVGAAVLGAIIGLANAGKKKRDERVGTPLPPAPYPEERYPDERDDRGEDGWNSSSVWADVDPDYANRFPSERAAIDACAREAETLGSRYGADARVLLIDDVMREGRETRVTGKIDSGNVDERDDFSRFTCFADGGQVTAFRFG